MIKGPKFLMGLILSTLNLFHLSGGFQNQTIEFKELTGERSHQQAASEVQEGLIRELEEGIQEKSSRKRCRSKKSKAQYDYIVVGTGTAGCVVARLLSDNRRNKVLALEWGTNLQDDPVIRSPILDFNLLSVNPKYSVNYPVALFQPLQTYSYSVGRALGGGSAHNFLIAVRGTPEIYDAWAALSGQAKWTYNNLLPFMKAIEHYTSNGSPINTSQRGTSGPLFITQTAPVQTDPWSIQVAGPGTQVGFVEDYNDPTQGDLGISSTQLYVTPPPNSQRSDAATAFLPVGEVIDAEGRGLDGRKLQVVFHALVNRILFDGKKAIGVEYIVSKNGQEKVIQVFGKKIILSAGAINSPAILERSGIGDSAILEPLEIPVIVNNSNVGNHLQNHYGPRALAIGGLQPAPGLVPAGFTDGRPFITDGVRRFQILDLRAGPIAQVIVGFILNPKSRGSTHIVSRDLTVYPNVDLNMYSDGGPSDIGSDANLAVTFYRVAQNIADAIGATIVFPPPSDFADPTGNLLLQDAKSSNGLAIVDHACGTTQMATSRAVGVVDGHLRVFGTKNLYIADNGVVPVIENGNTAWTAYVVGFVLAQELLNQQH